MQSLWLSKEKGWERIKDEMGVAVEMQLPNVDAVACPNVSMTVHRQTYSDVELIELASFPELLNRSLFWQQL